ncbi:MAG: hypothetical protein ACOCT0_02145, partial [Halobacteriota archaeon]
VEIDCPSGEARCIQEVLDRDDVDEYATVDEVLESLMTNLDADYVGRKRYDDRGPNHDVDHVSF